MTKKAEVAEANLLLSANPESVFKSQFVLDLSVGNVTTSQIDIMSNSRFTKK